MTEQAQGKPGDSRAPMTTGEQCEAVRGMPRLNRKERRLAEFIEGVVKALEESVVGTPAR